MCIFVGNKETMKKLTNWVFTYNDFTSQWQATTRDNYSLLFNDSTNSKVLRSKDMDSLIALIRKTEGDPVKIKRVVSERY